MTTILILATANHQMIQIQRLLSRGDAIRGLSAVPIIPAHVEEKEVTRIRMIQHRKKHRSSGRVMDKNSNL